MNVEEVANDYLSGHIDWHHSSREAEDGLVKLLQHVWNAGAEAALRQDTGIGADASHQKALPSFDLDKSALQKIYDAS